MMENRTIRLFISSPRDVQYERNIAKNVISEIGELYSKYVRLEVLMWEDLPLSSDSTFQEGIDYFLKEKPIDVAVFILWTRLGTPLSDAFRKKDGSPYNSGTEYEYDMMMELRQKSQGKTPRILTYIKSDEAIPRLSTKQELMDYFNQKEMLNAFVQEHFRDDESNSNYAYMRFGGNISFEQKFRAHLLTTIKSMIGDVNEIKEWEGNPYVGLSSFDFHHSAIFFGRRRLVYDTASGLVDFGDSKNRRSLLVLGESGSGKSSFIKAGLLPFFCNAQVSSCDHCSVEPSQFGGKMYEGIIDILLSEYGFLKDHPFLSEIRKGITTHDNYAYLTYALDHTPHKDLILHIDQFEELFDETQYVKEEREKVIHLLLGLISTMRISVFISMRSDFYFWLSRNKELSKIKSLCVVVDMPGVDVSEISEIVEEPARKACLKWEIDNHGESLNKRIITDALRLNELPLIEFALSELYVMRDDDDCLTFDAYQKIGGLEGAVVNYADHFYADLSEKEKATFRNLLGFVIAESTSNPGCYIRKTSLLEEAQKDNDYSRLIDKLIAAHLFVSGKDASGKATLSIVHEILISSWTVVSDWVEDEKDFLKRGGYYEGQAQYWIESGKSDRKLISGRTPLLEAEYHLFKNEKRVPSDVISLVSLSIKKKNRSGLVWRMIVTAFFFLSMLSWFLIKLTDSWDVLDPDFLETFGMNQLSWIDLLVFSVCVMLMLAHGIFLRFIGEPTYRTIRTSVFVWTLIFAISCLSLMCSTIQFGLADALLSESILLLPAVAGLTHYVFAYIMRKRWKKGFVSYLWSDMTEVKVKTISVASLLVIGITFSSALYMIALDEKEEKLERQAEVADTLFDGFENMKDRLSLEDFFYINDQRITFLDDNFSDEISDESADKRDLQYARSLLNLYQPLPAIDHLRKDKNWIHHLLWLICKDKAGTLEDIDADLEEYVNDQRYDEYHSYSTSNLIWLSEKAGRFDLADRLMDIVQDTLPDLSATPSFLINKGHVPLSKGDYESATRLYHQAISRGYMYGLNAETVRQSLQNDFYIFSRYEIIPDTVLSRVSSRLGVHFQPAAIPNSFPTVKEAYRTRLSGRWTWTDPDGNTLVYDFDDRLPYVTFNLYDDEDSNILRSLKNIRLAEMEDGGVLWEELDLVNDEHSKGVIRSLTDECLELEVMDNGDPDDKGQIREFVRMQPS